MIDLGDKIFVVIPAFNEEKTIENVINAVKLYCANIVVVNDFSTDNTSFLASQLAVHVIDLPENKGVGYATRIGCEYAIKMGAEYLITMDADGQHCADDIPQLFLTIKKTNSDIVFGFRERNELMPLYKRIGNIVLSFLNNLLFNVKLKDSLTGFHIINAKSFQSLKWESNRYSFISEFVYSIYKNKLKFSESRVKTLYFEKHKGMKVKDGIKSILLLFIWRFNLPKWLFKIFNLN